MAWMLFSADDAKELDARIEGAFGVLVGKLCAKIRALEAEMKEYEHLVEMQRKACDEATKLWRAEDPTSRATILPGLSTLIDWLMRERWTSWKERESAVAQLDELRVVIDPLALNDGDEERRHVVERVARERDEARSTIETAREAARKLVALCVDDAPGDVVFSAVEEVARALGVSDTTGPLAATQLCGAACGTEGCSGCTFGVGHNGPHSCFV
jgi:hypothetical protein